MTYTRKTCRFEEKCPVVGLRQGLDCAFNHHPDLRFEQVCARAEIKPHQARTWYAPSQSTKQITAAALARLVRVTKRYDLIDLWLQEYGLDDAVMVVPKTDGHTDHSVIDEVLDVAEKSGEVAAEVRQALRGDRRIDAEEAVRIRQRVRELQAEAAQADAALERIERPPVRFPRAASGA